MFSVRGLSIRAGRRLLVDDIAFEARPGKFVAVIGPNGAGKTTLLEALVGLREVAAGSVHFDDHSFTTLAQRAEVFAYLPDQSGLPIEASVRSIVEHARRHRRRLIKEDELRAALGIDELLPVPAGVLSRGERQRVALFSTLILGRPVVVLDEPFAVFDPLQLRELLAVLRRATEQSLVIASVHQLADADKVADRVLLLANGKRIAFGTLDALRAEADAPEAGLDALFALLLSRSRSAA